MSTLERLLARVYTLRARWRANTLRAARRAAVKVGNSQSASPLPAEPVGIGKPMETVPSHDAARSTKSRASKIPLRKRLTKSVLTLFPFFMTLSVVVFFRPQIPSRDPLFPNATLCFSRTGRGEFASVPLRAPQRPFILVPGAVEISAKPNGIKLVENDAKMAVQIEWQFGGSDSYDFIMTGPSGMRTSTHVIVRDDPIELLRADGMVVTIRPRVDH
jgi:hypothetical protein